MTGSYPSWPFLAGVLAVLAGLPVVFGDTYSLYIGSLVAIYTIAGFGVAILAGCCREISIGHSFFFAIGAYAYTLSSQPAGPGEWIGLVAALVLGTVGGLAFGLLSHRLTGPQFTLATLCLAIIAEQVSVEWKSVTGGFGGLSVSHRPKVMDWQLNPMVLYLAASVLAAASCLAFRNLQRSAWGRAFCSLGDAPLALASLGHSRLKVLAAALALSGAITALAGWFFAPVAKFVSPDALTPQLALGFLLVALLGGRRHPCGPLLGAIVVVGLPECLAFIPNSKLLVFACALLAVVYFLPGGIADLLMPFKRVTKAVPAPPPGDLVTPNRGRDLEVRNLSVHFDGVSALDQVNATFRAGTISFLVGPNGAGKTTLVNAIDGNVAGESGAILLGAMPFSTRTSLRSGQDKLARTFQQPQLFDSLSPVENVLVAMITLRWMSLPMALFGSQPSADQVRSAAEFLATFGYRGDLNAEISAIPFGSLRAIELARAVALRPAVLLLDEPSSGVDGQELTELIGSLRRIRSLGVTTIVVTHDARMIQETADHIIILEEGKITYSGHLEGSALHDHVYIPSSTA